MADDRYDRITWHDGGKTVDKYTAAALAECERRLGYSLTVVQGSYNAGGVSASAGTHDGGGVVDLSPWDWQNKVKVLRTVGFAAWHRTPIPGLWNEHIHAVLIGNAKLAPAAARQVDSYRAGRNGLADNAADHTWRPSPIPTFKYVPAPVKDLRADLVDISHFQDQRIDYAAAKKAGVRGLFHKATEGVTFEDANYAQRRAEAKKAGLPFGAYHFARPNSADDAILEARHFLKTADPQPGDLIPMLDLEDQGGLSRAALTSWVAVWAGAIRSALGVWPILYTPFDLDKTLGLMLWVARYNNENADPNVPKPWKRWDLRQFTNGVFGVPNHVAGFGHVDLSTMRDGLTLADLTIPVPAPPPAKPEPTAPTWELHVEHASLEVFDTAEEATADMAALFATNPDHASFTEANGGHSDELQAAATAAGYLIASGPSGERIAVAGRHTLLASGFVEVIPALDKPLDQGGHGPRGVLWATYRHERGETIAHCVTHRLTKSRDVFGQNPALVAALTAKVHELGAGATICTFAEDANVDDATNSLYSDAGLTTVWDALGKWPDTHGAGTIDVIGLRTGDKRATLAKAKAYKLGNSDHRRIGAWLNVVPL